MLGRKHGIATQQLLGLFPGRARMLETAPFLEFALFGCLSPHNGMLFLPWHACGGSGDVFEP